MLTIDALKSETVVPVIIVDHEGTISCINLAFERIWGWSKERLVGEPLTTIIPDALRDAHHMGFSRFALTGEPTILNQLIELVLVLPDGKEVKAEHFIIAEKISQKWVFGAMIKPLADEDGIG